MAFGLGARGGADDDAGEPAEGRQAGPLALGDLALVEGLASPETIARITGWSGWKVCSSPRLFLPVRPARPVTWLSSWKVRSAARGSPLARPRSASTTPTSVMFGKVVALGDELRADDDVGLALGDRLELQPQPLRAAENVGRQHDGARVGKMR